MTAPKFALRPLRIRIDDVQVNSGGNAGGIPLYELETLNDDLAVFRKVKNPRENPVRLTETQPPRLG